MMGAASRNLPEPPAREYIGRVFSQHRESEWLANFLTSDETIAAACLVDACALAESENPGFDEWLPQVRLSGYDPFRSANPATTDRSTIIRIPTTPLHSWRTYGFVFRLA